MDHRTDTVCVTGFLDPGSGMLPGRRTRCSGRQKVRELQVTPDCACGPLQTYVKCQIGFPEHALGGSALHPICAPGVTE
jgi:hypothetical protein